MTEELISFETAKLAYNKRFDWIKSDNKWYEDNGDLDFSFQGYDENTENKITAPTQSLLQKWLREKHEIYVNVKAFNNNESIMFFCDYYDFKNLTIKAVTHQKTYEEALEKGLFEALKLI